MKGLKISNMIGKGLIMISILLMIGTMFVFADIVSQNSFEHQPVVILPSGVQYIIKDPFQQKDNLLQMGQLIVMLIGDITLTISGTVVCISTKKQINKINKANHSSDKW